MLKDITSMKLIAKIEVSKRLTGKIYFDKEYNDYIVSLFVDGKIDLDSQYFTQDKSDALNTLEAMISFTKQPYGV